MPRPVPFPRLTSFWIGAVAVIMSLKIWLIAVLLLAAYVAPSLQEDQADPEQQEDIDEDAPNEIEDDENEELSELDSEDPSKRPYCGYGGYCYRWCKSYGWKMCKRYKKHRCCYCCKGYKRKGDEPEMNPAEENDEDIEDPSRKKCRRRRKCRYGKYPYRKYCYYYTWCYGR